MTGAGSWAIWRTHLDKRYVGLLFQSERYCVLTVIKCHIITLWSHHITVTHHSAGSTPMDC